VNNLNDMSRDLLSRGRDLCNLARRVEAHTIHDSRSGELTLRVDHYRTGRTVAELDLRSTNEGIHLKISAAGTSRHQAITALVQKLLDGVEELSVADPREGETPA
jgi:hypothetical protein